LTGSPGSPGVVPATGRRPMVPREWGRSAGMVPG
jgi:hypothetical protein